MNEVRQNACFKQGSLQDCDLSEAILQGARFEGVAMYGANFGGSDLNRSEFYLALGIDAKFDGARMQGAKFFGGSFEDASFAGADLTGASFLPDNMGGYVDLSGADFTDAKLDQVLFDSAVYSDKTKFPVGFQFQHAGLKRKE